MAVVRSSEAASGTETKLFVPLKLSALPNLPAVDQVAPEIGARCCAPPELSAVVVPMPSSKP